MLKRGERAYVVCKRVVDFGKEPPRAYLDALTMTNVCNIHLLS